MRGRKGSTVVDGIIGAKANQPETSFSERIGVLGEEDG